MLEASIQTITARDKDSTFTVFTIYPDEDKRFNTYDNVSILGAKPLFLGTVINPLSLLYKLLPPIRGLLKKQKHIKALAESGVLLDQGGITFVDGREKFLIYNLATILPGFFTNTRVIKCSQAMGPFSGVNKFIAKLTLPRVETICARGDKTREHLDTLVLSNVIDSTDYAFLMNVTSGETEKADVVLRSIGKTTKKTIGVLPSEVIRKKTEGTDQDYIKYNQQIIEGLLDDGYHVVLMAYSARENTELLHNNDLPVCRSISSRINHDSFTFIDEELSAQQLRHIIEKMDVIIASRFHAMVAALSVNTPPLVLGWSHKYAEIMRMFDLESLAYDSKEMSSELTLDKFKDVMKNKANIEKKIRKALPGVKENAQRQVDAIFEK